MRITKGTLAGYSLTRVLPDLVQITVPVAGALEFKSRAKLQAFASTSQLASVVRPFEKVTQSVAAGTGLVLVVPISVLTERAELLTQRSFSPGRAINDMAQQIDLKRPVGRFLARNLQYLLTESIEADQSGLADLALAGFEESILNFATASLWPSIADELESRPRSATPAAIRSARDYLVERALEPVEIATLAATLGMSMRSLQENFQRYFGLSPRDFILKQRLEIARQQLVNPSTSTSVTDVAVHCGFYDASRFAAKYRDRYGELPSETLRRARL